MMISTKYPKGVLPAGRNPVVYIWNPERVRHDGFDGIKQKAKAMNDLSPNMDFKAFAADLGLSLNEFVNIVAVFMSAAERDIRKMEAACDLGDSGDVAKAAHSLKGSSGNLGFRNMSELARRMETDAKKNPAVIERDLIRTIRRELAGILSKLNAARQPS
jgi:histidine phosphotransfer protein HptB